MEAMNSDHVMARRSAPWPSSWITTPGEAELVMTKQVFISRSPALRDDEAIQLDRHGALRAPRDDNQFLNILQFYGGGISVD
jgi:hypothetical protein